MDGLEMWRIASFVALSSSCSSSSYTLSALHLIINQDPQLSGSFMNVTKTMSIMC